LDFLAVDELAFKHPVPIGAVLQLNAQVVYSTGDLIHVEVIADVICVQSGDRKTTNTFHFTYRLAEEGRKLVIKPATYVEAMKYLEGKRRIESASESKNYSELYQF
jgi:acyl-coenzyme A thioesterase 9